MKKGIRSCLFILSGFGALFVIAVIGMFVMEICPHPDHGPCRPGVLRTAI